MLRTSSGYTSMTAGPLIIIGIVSRAKTYSGAKGAPTLHAAVTVISQAMPSDWHVQGLKWCPSLLEESKRSKQNFFEKS